MRLDNSQSYHGTTNTISLLADTDEEIIKRSVKWDLTAFAFQPEISATNFFSLIGFFNYIYPKGHRKN